MVWDPSPPEAKGGRSKVGSGLVSSVLSSRDQLGSGCAVYTAPLGIKNRRVYQKC